jgi:hypothetical protein
VADKIKVVFLFTPLDSGIAKDIAESNQFELDLSRIYTASGVIQYRQSKPFELYYFKDALNNRSTELAGKNPFWLFLCFSR